MELNEGRSESSSDSGDAVVLLEEALMEKSRGSQFRSPSATRQSPEVNSLETHGFAPPPRDGFAFIGAIDISL